MQWEVISVIIVAALFILGHVIRRGEEMPPRNLRQRPQPGEPPRRAASDIDRFLEEMNRLRQRPSEPEYRPEPPPLPRPVQLVIPPERPAPSRTDPRTTAGSTAVAGHPRRAAGERSGSSSATGGLGGCGEGFACGGQLRELLRSPQSLRTAILLQEVLGPPRCRKVERK